MGKRKIAVSSVARRVDEMRNANPSAVGSWDGVWVEDLVVDWWDRHSCLSLDDVLIGQITLAEGFATDLVA